jgi:hypothetical protein
MSRLAIPLDSLAVVPAIGSDAAGAIWSEAFAADLADLFAGAPDLRVVPAGRAASWAALALSPEEIGRGLNVRCVVVCDAMVSGDDVDVRVEAIDVLAESTICATSLLTAAGEAMRVPGQIARWLSCCFGGQCDSDERLPMREDVYPRVLRARAMQRSGRVAEAIGELRECASIDVGACDAFAQAVLDAPDERIAADVIRAAAYATDLTRARVQFRFGGDADEAFLRATDGSCDPAAHAHYGIFLVAMGRPQEAERELRCARELSEPFMAERMLVELGMRVLRGETPLNDILERLNLSGLFTPNSPRSQSEFIHRY